MSLSARQYQDIMNEYDRIRRRNHRAMEERRERVCSQIPEIRRIDEEIAHVSVEKAREMLLRRTPGARDSLRETIYGLSMEKINLLAIHDFPADYLDPIYDCPVCQDTGYVDSRKCACFQQKILAILYGESNIGEAVRKENFSAFRTEFYSDAATKKGKLSPRENIRNVLSLSHDFIRDFETHPGGNLLIYGNAGVGKTFLSHCIAGEILKKGKSVIYLTAWQFFEQLADYTFRRGEENANTLPSFLQCDLLIIDDLGTELNNTFSNSQLFLCMNERILKKKSVIISTNLSLEQINATYTERVFSRIIQSYTLLHIYGEDIRIKKAFSSLDEY